MTDVRAQVEAHYRQERLAIITADGDVTEAQAAAILECEDEADVVRALSADPVCSCGTHTWGPS